MTAYDVVVIGGGPAGLCAAIAAAEHGASTCIVDRQDSLGGQLVKQTHKFFGSKDELAGTRGIEIARILSERLARLKNATVLLEATALGYYPDNVLTVEHGGAFKKIHASSLIVATGASERMLAFPNNDLPGVYGAGAAQTLMNLHGVRPGDTVLMVGAGNIGLIVSYQLRQAGVNVAAVVEAAPVIGGYAVHASKIRRIGIPVLTRHSVKEVLGREAVESAVIWRLDASWQGIPGTESVVQCDVVCLATGLTPLVEILWQAGCRMKRVPELGGHVPVSDENMQTTVPGVFVAGDAAGVEEASAAMLTGRLAGLGAAHRLGCCPEYGPLSAEARRGLASLRTGPTSDKIRAGLQKLKEALP
ncbi:MAG: FAD-dependent oxidoreductase [Bacillota bacterium]|nr:FAD-dependent oxidoreductase [Bacillota bacterium]